MDGNGDGLYEQRQKRICDAIALKVPDRVPVWMGDAGYFPARYSGFTCEEVMFDSDKLFAAYRKTLTDFAPDAFFGPGVSIRSPAGALEALDCKTIRLPGRGVSAKSSHQALELEGMKAEEYDEFLDDPVEFAIRRFLPRVHGVMKPLENLPPLHGLLSGYSSTAMSALFAQPEFFAAFEAWYKAGLIVRKHQTAAAAFMQEMKVAGFPQMFVAGVNAPFDIISDYLRGMRGTMTDMYRRPEKLLAAIDKLTPRVIGSAIAAARASGNPGVVLTLHRGADGFMSLKQVETFYWPSLKKVLLALVDAGLTPYPFFEGDYTSRLEYLATLPKGKILGLFDNTDPAEAKKALGGTMCIAGMMPASLLQVGTPEEVRAYTRKLIDVVGKDGGYMMGPKSIMDEAKPELVKIWFDTAKEYGVYA